MEVYIKNQVNVISEQRELILDRIFSGCVNLRYYYSYIRPVNSYWSPNNFKHYQNHLVIHRPINVNAFMDEHWNANSQINLYFCTHPIVSPLLPHSQLSLSISLKCLNVN